MEINNDMEWLLSKIGFTSLSTNVIYKFGAKILVAREWLIIDVNGVIKSGIRSVHRIPSIRTEFVVQSEDRFFKLRLRSRLSKLFFLKQESYIKFEFDLTEFARDGHIFEKPHSIYNKFLYQWLFWSQWYFVNNLSWYRILSFWIVLFKIQLKTWRLF